MVFDDSGGSYAVVGWRAGILTDEHFLAAVGLGQVLDQELGQL